MRRVVVVLLVVVVAVCTSAAAPRAGVPPVCGGTVTGYVRLRADLTCTTDVGLHLTGTGTLDLGGHTIRRAHPGAPSQSGGTTVALLYDNEARFTIRNGRVSGWGDGVLTFTDDNESIELTRLERMVFTDNGSAVFGYFGDVEVRASVFRGNGVAVGTFWGDARVVDSVLVENDSAFDVGLGIGVVSRSVFLRNGWAASCGEGALEIDHSQFVDNEIGVLNGYCGEGTFRENTFVRNTTGLLSSAMTYGEPVVQGNSFLDNGTAILLELGGIIDGNHLRDNDRGIVWEKDYIADFYTLTITDNHLVRNGDGIVVPIRASVGSNVVVDGSGWGINTPEAIDLGGNVAHGNGREPQCVGVVCSAGGP